MSIFIYQVEANPKYAQATNEIFNWLAHPGHSAVTSAITITELLVRPYREKDRGLISQFYGLLSTFPNLEWLPLTLGIADLAARFRADYALRTPSAIQAATAVEGTATGFLTNDFSFERVHLFETLVLDTFISS